MHKIVKALELASQERASRRSSAVAEPMPIESKRAVESAAAPAACQASKPAQPEVASIRVLPELLERNRILTGAGEDPATRAVKLLRTQVLRRLEAQGWGSIAVVSPAAEEGKTLTAINLGIALASSAGRTAVLVDLDWRHPSVHRYFGFDPEHDVLACLDGNRPVAEVLINPGIPRFFLLPCRAPVPGASERLGDPALRAFHDELRSHYPDGVLLFDLPPLLATDDALSFIPIVDAVLVVIEEGRTRRDDVARVLELIDPSRVLGMVVNKSSRTLPEY